MDSGKSMCGPYVGPRPFEQRDQPRFFGRTRETEELASLIVANRIVLLYAQSGAGKTSLINAGLLPMLEQRGFDIFPIARVQGFVPPDMPLANIRNLYVFNALACWKAGKEEHGDFAQMSLAEFLAKKTHRTDEMGYAQPRLAVFDQFEELFTVYPERWQDREDFFQQVVVALEGSPLFLQAGDIVNGTRLLQELRDPKDQFAKQLADSFSDDAQVTLLRTSGESLDDIARDQMIADELNQAIQRRSLLEMAVEADPELPETIRSRAEEYPQGEELLRFNRHLLHHLYPHELPGYVDGDPFLRVVFVMREEYLAQLDSYLPLFSELLKIRYRLERLQKDAAQQAIQEPVQGTHRRFAPGVADKLVGELLKARGIANTGERVDYEGQYVEPVHLQVVCQRLWSSLPDDTTEITQKHLQDYADVNIALEEFYNKAICTTIETGKIDELALRNWFEHTLITPMGTRSTVFRDVEKGETGGLPNALVDLLVDQYIVRAERRAGTRWYELTHDRFIEPIQVANKAWRKQWRATHRNPLSDPAQEWQRLGRDEGCLFAGRQLDEAEAWAKQHRPEVEALEQEFLDASIELRRRQQKERDEQRQRELDAAQKLADEAEARRKEQTIAAQKLRRRAIWLSVACGFAVLFLLVAVWFAFDSTIAAQEATIGVAKLLASESQRELTTKPQLSLLLAVEGVETAQELGEGLAYTLLEKINNWTDMQSGQEVDERSAISVTLQALQQSLATTTSLPLREPTGQVITDTTSIAMSPDGRWLALASTDGYIQIWDQTTDINGLYPVFDEYVHNGPITVVDFSQDGRWLATGSANGVIGLLDMTQKPVKVQRDTVQGSVLALAFHPTEGWLAVSQDTKQVQRIEVPLQAENEPKILLESPEESIATLVFSPFGDQLATATTSDTLRIWSLRSTLPLVEDASQLLSKDKNGIVAFSPDGRWLAAGSREKPSVTLYDFGMDAQEHQPLAFALPGHEQGIKAVSFSPESHLLAVGGGDGIVRLWDLRELDTAENPTEDQAEVEDESTPSDIPARPDSPFAALNGADELPSVPANLDPIQLPRRPQEIRALDFRRLELQVGLEFRSDLEQRNLSQDFREALADAGIALTSTVSISDTIAEMGGEWCISDAEQTLMVSQTDTALHIYGDTWLVSAGADGAVQLWDISNLKAPETTLYGHDKAVGTVLFQPLQRLVVAAGTDGTVRTWNLDTDPLPQQLLQLQRDLKAWETEACRRAGRDFSPDDERNKYLGDKDSRSACTKILAQIDE